MRFFPLLIIVWVLTSCRGTLLAAHIVVASLHGENVRNIKAILPVGCRIPSSTLTLLAFKARGLKVKFNSMSGFLSSELVLNRRQLSPSAGLGLYNYYIYREKYEP